MLPSLIIVIGATEDTHMLSVYLSTLVDVKSEEKEKRRAKRLPSWRDMSVYPLLTTLTTFLGFAANSFTAMDLIKDLLLHQLLGAANGVITILFVPLILALVGPLKTSIVSEEKRICGVQGLILAS